MMRANPVQCGLDSDGNSGMSCDDAPVAGATTPAVPRATSAAATHLDRIHPHRCAGCCRSFRFRTIVHALGARKPRVGPWIHLLGPRAGVSSRSGRRRDLKHLGYTAGIIVWTMVFNATIFRAVSAKTKGCVPLCVTCPNAAYRNRIYIPVHEMCFQQFFCSWQYSKHLSYFR